MGCDGILGGPGLREGALLAALLAAALGETELGVLVGLDLGVDLGGGLLGGVADVLGGARGKVVGLVLGRARAVRLLVLGAVGGGREGGLLGVLRASAGVLSLASVEWLYPVLDVPSVLLSEDGATEGSTRVDGWRRTGRTRRTGASPRLAS